MKFTFRGFSEGMLPSPLTSSELARGAVLWALAHFFENGNWGSPAEMGVEGQSLTPEDHLYVLMQAALYLTVTRGFAAPEARTCYERVESLCHSLNRPFLLYSALTSRWRYSLWTDKVTALCNLAAYRTHSPRLGA